MLEDLRRTLGFPDNVPGPGERSWTVIVAVGPLTHTLEDLSRQLGMIVVGANCPQDWGESTSLEPCDIAGIQDALDEMREMFVEADRLKP